MFPGATEVFSNVDEVGESKRREKGKKPTRYRVQNGGDADKVLLRVEKQSRRPQRRKGNGKNGKFRKKNCYMNLSRYENAIQVVCF